MENSIIEVKYPISFRIAESKKLGEYLRHRESVDLIGMKRVGISNFLRFFMYHENLVETYIASDQKHLYIPIDLNDLIEREIFPFWTLTLKRIVDAVNSSSLPNSVKKQIEFLFLNCIQSQDLFLLLDSIRQACIKIVESDVLPTMFFLRFDRIKDAVTPEFFANLQGLRDATHQRLAYVFTSFRSLESLSPTVFTRPVLSIFSREMYIKPASEKDMEIIYKTYRDRYKLVLPQALEQALFENVGGNIQYLQLALIILHEKRDASLDNENDLFTLLVSDERIILQSEELWDSLTNDEQQVLSKIRAKESVSEIEKQNGLYLWETGFVVGKEQQLSVFSPLLEYYIEHIKEKTKANSKSIHLSKKEHMLFTLLHKNLDQICEREKIIENVWPEYIDLGVSDWAIDRLVARVRSKLKIFDNQYEIVTVRTRGYKLVQATS